MYKISDGTDFAGKSLIFLPKCHSTNDIAAELLERGLAGDRSVVITDHQTAGKGQRGNQWESAPGQNLTFSVILQPELLMAENNFFLNIVVSLALTDALLHFGNGFFIKWPNDIYHGRKKVGGILIENSIISGKIFSSIIGIGLNVNQLNFTQTENAVSLGRIFSRQFDLNLVLNLILKSLDRRIGFLHADGFDDLRNDYLNRLLGLGEKRKFLIGGSIRQGIIDGIDSSGRLIVTRGSMKQRFNFQEIKFLI